MRLFAFLLLGMPISYVFSDTIEHYMNIAENIPRMEMKADPQSQTWARSARNVLIITAESIAETLTETNEEANRKGAPLFCLNSTSALNGIAMDNLIQETWRNVLAPQGGKQNMTVSQVAWLGITRKYPCNTNTAGVAARQIMQSVAVRRQGAD